MADVLIVRYEFLQNNPFGTFVQGDILDVYVDPDLTIVPATGVLGEVAGVSVKLNNVAYPDPGGGGTFILLGSATQTVQDYNPNICNGTYKLLTGALGFYPYGQYISLADHPSCEITAPVCDLTIQGTPEVIGATGSSSFDGSLTVTATSSRAIKYKLGSDFAYNDGTGQLTGEFTGLSAGYYRIYIRDAANCSANILIQVPIDNTYTTKYQIEYKVRVGGQHVSNTKLEIRERSYSGGITEVIAGDTPLILSLRGEGEDDKFYPVLSTNANVTLISQTNFQFQELFTSDPKRWLLVYWKDTLQGFGYLAQWEGFLEPAIYQEEYKAPPYEVSFTFTDRLASLKDYVFAQPDGLKYTGTMRAMTLIAQCLQKTGLTIPIRCACNIYASGMDTTASDDPLDQSYIDVERFYITEEIPTYDTVLKSILEAFGARLIQVGQRWTITRVEELNASFDYREYDYTGVYVTNNSWDPIIDRVPPHEPGYWWINGDQTMEIRPAYGAVNVNYDLGLLPNILRNGDFSLITGYNPVTGYGYRINTSGFQIVNAGYTISESIEFIGTDNVAIVLTGGSNTTGAGYIQSNNYNLSMGSNNLLKITVRYKVPIYNVPYQKVRVVVKYGTYYLGSSGAWTTLENEIIFYVTTYGEYVESEVLSAPPPGSLTGANLFVRVYHSYVYHSTDATWSALRTVATTSLPLATRRNIATLYYELENNTDAQTEPSIIRPNDYNASTNPVQWILKDSAQQVSYSEYSFAIDKIQARVLINGSDPVSVVEINKVAQVSNNTMYSKTLYFGSLMQLIKTKPALKSSTGFVAFPNTGEFNIITQSIPGANIIYAGWLRADGGTAWTNWTRDGVPESRKLNEISQLVYSAQYNKPYRRLTGSLISTSYFNFLKTLKETFDNDRLYIPMSGEFNDKQNSFTGEFVELVDVDATPAVPFSSAFTTGFGGGFD